MIGDTTFLFQFVAPPPIQPKPQLPVAVLRGASAIDWNTTIIAAVSFLFHFLLLGSIYSDWLDPIVDDELSVAGVIDSLKSLPPPPPVEDKPEEKPDESKQADQGARQGAGSGCPGRARPQSAGRSPRTRSRPAALHNDLDQLRDADARCLGEQRPSDCRCFEGQQVATSALDQAAASSAGRRRWNG